MRKIIALTSFLFLILCFVGCGKAPESPLGNSDEASFAPGSVTLTYEYDEESDTCKNEEGQTGYNEDIGECSDLTLFENDQLASAIREGQDITGSIAEGVDFSGSEVDLEYILVNRLKVNDSTVLGDQSYFDENEASSTKTNLCEKWLAKKNRRTGEYPSGIYKKIVRLNCLS